MRIIGKTDIGRTRSENQDNFRSGSLSNGLGWGIVCDGMGGAQNGRLASMMACAAMENALYKRLNGRLSQDEVQAAIEESIVIANDEVFKRASQSSSTMGTTLVCAVALQGVLHVAHVGDSRAYLFNGKTLAQITKDHSMVQELVDNGTISPDVAKHHPEKNVITRAIGVDKKVQWDYSRRNLSPGDLVLLCTDGLTNLVSDERIARQIQTVDFYDLPMELVQDALQAGGTDNITVLLMQTQKGVLGNG